MDKLSQIRKAHVTCCCEKICFEFINHQKLANKFSSNTFVLPEIFVNMSDSMMDWNYNARKLRIKSWRHVHLPCTRYALQPETT